MLYLWMMQVCDTNKSTETQTHKTQTHHTHTRTLGIPSLLSLPYLKFCNITDPIYQNTRKFLLSSDNPWYFSGNVGAGIGSVHIGKK
jgi:hypothetical protein